MNKAIISAPFGCYLTIPGTTSTRGTYTATKRPGATWGAMTRIHFTRKGIVNKMGLRNPGIKSQNFAKHKDVIWSIAGLDMLDWSNVMLAMPSGIDVELNLSCVNVNQAMFPYDFKRLFRESSSWFRTVIVKLPSHFNKAAFLYTLARNEGITHFHCCNTIKTDKGGLSGRSIQEFSLKIIEYIKKDPGTVAIGGGGIYSKDDVRRYRDAEADYFSLGTILMVAPWNVPGVLAEINRV